MLHFKSSLGVIEEEGVGAEVAKSSSCDEIANVNCFTATSYKKLHILQSTTDSRIKSGTDTGHTMFTVNRKSSVTTRKFEVGIETKINYDAVEMSWTNLKVSRKSSTRSTSNSTRECFFGFFSSKIRPL